MMRAARTPASVLEASSARRAPPLPRSRQRRYGSISADGAVALFPCGSASPGGVSSIMRINADGVVDTRTTWNGSAPQGVASLDGTAIYASAVDVCVCDCIACRAGT